MSLIANTAPAIEALMHMRHLDWKRAIAGNMSDERYREMFGLAGASLQNAEPYWWHSDICQVVQAAAKSLPTWTFREELLPSPQGFFWFANPLPWPRTDQTTIDHLRAVSWIQDSTGAWGFIGWADWPSDRNYQHPLVPVRELGPLHHGHSVDGRAKDFASQPHPIFLDRFIGACLLFLEQKVATSSLHFPDRATRRRMQRAGRLDYPRGIKVIILRRSQLHSGSESSEPVDWQVRWIVRGHWRQQFYASDQSHRPIWISPHVKGPEGKPLKTPKESVFAVIR